MKRFITFLILFITGLFAVNTQAKQEEPKGITMISLFGSESESSDPTRTTSIDGNITVYSEKLKLSELKATLELKIKDAFDLPNTLRVLREKEEMFKPLISKVSRNIHFEVKISELKIGDRIIVTTNDGRMTVDMEVVK